jgi:hypothetical protein
MPILLVLIILLAALAGPRALVAPILIGTLIGGGFMLWGLSQ